MKNQYIIRYKYYYKTIEKIKKLNQTEIILI